MPDFEMDYRLAEVIELAARAQLWPRRPRPELAARWLRYASLPRRVDSSASVALTGNELSSLKLRFGAAAAGSRRQRVFNGPLLLRLPMPIGARRASAAPVR